ncbi:dolichyl-diphosphooligosaccharide-protein glycotransferase [Saccharomycopsis crataegensis]|uniref:Ribophorin II n=1 Tax=Saccharomycopsis crataegensis TaxID=43959 RepID=A0AAV5QLL1_9ASCO|nr:dolichyl-diphosphooligosaccharide-protein glycotransferase [Saccharomycopsis crataegensis]
MLSTIKSLFFLVCLLNVAVGFKVHNGVVSVGAKSEKFTCCDPIETPVSITTDKDSIDFKFSVLDPEGKEPYRPNQVVVVLSKQESSLEQSFIPKFNSKNAASVSIAINEISKNLLFFETNSEEPVLDVSIILGDYAINSPVVKKIGSIKFAGSLVKKLSKNYSKPSRSTVKPEIRHIFRSPEKQVSPIIATFFISLIAASFLWFVGTLLAHGTVNLKNFGAASGEPVFYGVYKIAFIGSIIAFEAFFIQYYIGDSIFNLIFKTAILAGPSVWFGSRVFRSLLQKKVQDGKA